MAAPDPVDVRLLTFVAESGRAAVPEIATRLGMDPRDVAARLTTLSASGLPLVVGVECDPNGIRQALAATGAFTNQPSGPYPVNNQPSGGYPVGPQTTAHPGANPAAVPQHSGPHSGPHSGSYPNYGATSGPYPAQAGPSGPQPPQQFPGHGAQPAPTPAHPGQPHQGTQGHGPGQATTPHMSAWGPPGAPPQPVGEAKTVRNIPASQVAPRAGKVGSKLDITSAGGGRVTIQLVEVVDPADFLFSAAGHTLGDGDRAVVVHTELTNNGTVPFVSVPDEFLVLVATDGTTVSKSTVTLSSRPPHNTGVPPGQTAGGHTVFVLPDATELAAVRWSALPGDQQRALTWDVSDL